MTGLASLGEQSADTLGFDFAGTLDDILCSAEYYCAQGFEALDATLSGSEGLDDNQRQAAVQGSLELFDKTLRTIRTELAAFREEALLSTLHIPSYLLQPTAQAIQQEVPSGKSEAELDAELKRLRQQIIKTNLARRSLSSAADGMQRQLAEHGNAAPLEKVVSHVAAGKENLGDDAADIAEKALQLIPMLQHAEQIFARHQSRTALHTSQEAALLAEKEVARCKAMAGGASLEHLGQLMQYFT